MNGAHPFATTSCAIARVVRTELDVNGTQQLTIQLASAYGVTQDAIPVYVPAGVANNFIPDGHPLIQAMARPLVPNGPVDPGEAPPLRRKVLYEIGDIVATWVNWALVNPEDPHSREGKLVYWVVGEWANWIPPAGTFYDPQ